MEYPGGWKSIFDAILHAAMCVLSYPATFSCLKHIAQCCARRLIMHLERICASKDSKFMVSLLISTVAASKAHFFAHLHLWRFLCLISIDRFLWYLLCVRIIQSFWKLKHVLQELWRKQAACAKDRPIPTGTQDQSCLDRCRDPCQVKKN